MATLDRHTRELVFKLVFYGPGLGGKTTTLQTIYAGTKAAHRGKLVALATSTDRTLYFDYLPVRVPAIRGFRARIQLFTVPGQVYYAATRKLVLTGADGVVFVADSSESRMDINVESLDDLEANLRESGRSLESMPHTFQWNKRDISDAAAEGELDRMLNRHGAPAIGTVATRGQGVFDGLERALRLVMAQHGDVVEAPVDEPALAAIRRGESARPDGPVLRADDIDGASSTRTSGEPIASVRPADERGSVAPVRSGEARLTFSALAADGEREIVARIEAQLAQRAFGSAVLLADELFVRALARAGALTPSHGASRDPAIVAMLLGVSGAEYLKLRAAVRTARRGEALSEHAALEAYVLVLRALTSLRHVASSAPLR